MASRNTIAHGNWSNPANWDGGVVLPNLAVDTITLKHAVTLDQDLPLSGTGNIVFEKCVDAGLSGTTNGNLDAPSATFTCATANFPAAVVGCVIHIDTKDFLIASVAPGGDVTKCVITTLPSAAPDGATTVASKTWWVGSKLIDSGNRTVTLGGGAVGPGVAMCFIWTVYNLVHTSGTLTVGNASQLNVTNSFTPNGTAGLTLSSVKSVILLPSIPANAAGTYTMTFSAPGYWKCGGAWTASGFAFAGVGIGSIYLYVVGPVTINQNSFFSGGMNGFNNQMCIVNISAGFTWNFGSGISQYLVVNAYGASTCGGSNVFGGNCVMNNFNVGTSIGGTLAGTVNAYVSTKVAVGGLTLSNGGRLNAMRRDVQFISSLSTGAFCSDKAYGFSGSNQ